MNALERVPEVAAAIVSALAAQPAGLPVDQVAQAIGEDSYVTGLACRHLRQTGGASWARVSGSRQWLVRLVDGPGSPPPPPLPPVCFRTFAREMGFSFEDVRVVRADAEQFAAPRFRGPQPDRSDEG